MVVLDSEWHALLACPLTRAARARFQLSCGELVPGLFRALAKPDRPNVKDLAKLIIHSRESRALRDGFSRLAVEVVALRRREFRALASRVPSAVH